MKTIIIAEAGVNHNGSLKTAMKMVDVASKAKADFIKFQTFVTENLVIKDCNLAQYQKRNTNYINQFEMLKKLSLSFDDFIKLKKGAKKKKLDLCQAHLMKKASNF